jgi:hypothetical protein
MKPIVITTVVDLDGPPALVWRLLVDWERQGDWMLEASDFVVTSPHREGIGVEAEATIKIGGISTRDKVRVDVWEPPHKLGIAHLGWVAGRGDMELVATNGGAQLRWLETLYPPWGVIGAAGIRVFKPLMARIFRRDAVVLRKLVVEAVAGRYPESHP